MAAASVAAYQPLTIQATLLFNNAPDMYDLARVPRYIPYELYVDSHDSALAEEIHDVFVGVLEMVGLRPLPPLPVVTASKRIRGVVETKPVTRGEFERLTRLQTDVIQKLTQALALRSEHDRAKVQTETAKMLAEAEQIRQQTAF